MAPTEVADKYLPQVGQNENEVCKIIQKEEMKQIQLLPISHRNIRRLIIQSAAFKIAIPSL
jgi:hypothetical protein